MSPLHARSHLRNSRRSDSTWWWWWGADTSQKGNETRQPSQVRHRGDRSIDPNKVNIPLLLRRSTGRSLSDHQQSNIDLPK